MSTSLSKADLRLLAEHLASLRPPGPRPLTADQLVVLDVLVSKVHRLIESHREAPERGELVFDWRVPQEWAMTLNAYAGKPGWSKRKIRLAMDDAARKLLSFFPKAELHGAQRKRWARVTRFSARRPDELAVDIVGGKLAIDALSRVGVLCDDNDRWLIREARWEKAKPGDTHVLVEIFEVAAEGVHAAEPKPAKVKQIRYDLGPMTKAILGR